MIRPAHPSDAAAITALWNDVILHTELTFTTVLKEHDDIASFIADPARCVLVVEDAGRFAGFALIGGFRSGPGYAHTVEHSIYLSPNSHGKGLGRALMQGLEDGAKALGHHVIVAGITGANPNAVRFHENVGYKQVAHMLEVGHKNGKWHDLILMQKIL